MPQSGKKTDIESQLQATEQRYQAFIHNSLEGIWRFELDDPIPINLPPEKQIELVFKLAYLAEANDAMAQMYGLQAADQLVGSRLTDLMDPSVEQNIDYLKAFIAADYSLQGVESQEIDSEGNIKYFLNSLIGIVENDAICRAWGTQLDVTEQHRMTVALKESEERLGLALKASHLGMWEWHTVTGALSWSDELHKIYAVPRGQEVTYELYMSRIHEEDRAQMQSTIQKSMLSGKPYETEHRIVWPDSTTHWVLSRGQAFIEDGNPIRMVGTCMNIDERKAAEELKVKNALLNSERKELVRLNKSKDDFIALASHQLRTPATSVKQYLGMLLEGYVGELGLTDQQMDLLQTAYDSNERQIEIINDLLLIATIDAGKIKLKRQPIDIVHFLKEIVDDYEPKYADHKQTIRFKPSEKSLKASVDHARLRMALENLIDNASKYSEEGTTTTITVEKSKDAITIAVTDQGVGIDQKDFAKLFQKFSRLPNSLSRSSDGSGLGLYWSHKIIALHGGALEVTSEPGKGSTFAVTLVL